MKHIPKLFAILLCLAGPQGSRAAEVRVTLIPGKVLNRVDERVYGQFLEHIFHSVNGGLWGELVADRSFEDPPKQKDGGVAGGWRAFGDARFERTRSQPLNSDFCQHITVGTAEAGVLQEPFLAEQDREYSGSLFARGNSGPLIVRLRDGSETIAEARLDAPGGQWKEFSFVLRPRRTARAAALAIAVPAGGDVWLDQVSLMSDAARKTGGFRPDLLQAVAELRPPTIRWPGGSFAAFYRWKDAIGPQHQRRKYPQRIWDDQDVNSFGTDEFLALCRRVGAEPVICLNIGSTVPAGQREALLQEACDWVEYCNGPADSRWGRLRAEHGHPEPYRVKYWEIGNEVWNLKPDEYVGLLRRFAAALKKIDPSIQQISCGSGELGKYWAAGDRAVISQAAELVQYHSVHHYEDPNRFAQGPAAMEKFLQDLQKQIAASRNPDLKLYVSEWNAQSTDWRTGLYAAGALNVFERQGDLVPMACPALWLRHVSARSWDNAFINFDHQGWFPAPNYVVMKLWRDHFGPVRIAAEGEAGPLNIVATKSADGRQLYWKAVNPTADAVEVVLRVDGASISAAALKLVAPDSLQARNTLAAPRAVHPADGTVALDGDHVRFTLPRWSAGALRLTLR